MALSQVNAPIYEALRRFRRMRVVPFDVPGHKRGRGNMELTEFLGEDCMNVDVNSMKPLDNLCHPVSVIRDAEELAAEAFGAATIDYSKDSIVLRLTDDSRRIDDFINLMRDYTILEICRTGIVSLSKGASTIRKVTLF